jgi:RecB family exonuclease
MGAFRLAGLPLPDILRFLLVPDRSSARNVRRALASAGARCGTVVGTWAELVDQAGRAYLPAPPSSDWKERLAAAARESPDAFWSESMKADPENTPATLGRELRRLLAALGPGRELRPAETSRLSGRGKRHLADLARLHDAMGRALPEDLAAIRALLDADASEAVRRIAVHRVSGSPPLSPWQEALLAKLATDCGPAADPSLDAVLAAALDPRPAGADGSALRRLQESLFAPEAPRGKPDDSVTCLAVRDDLEAAEVAAGTARKALSSDPGLQTSDIGLLLPGDGSCDRAVREVFAKAGLPLSGLEDPSRLRNLGGEAVFHFLATRRRPAPSMALAALYASPLMPWDEAVGNRLAMKIMERKFDPKAPEELSPEGMRMMALIREPQESPGALADALRSFRSLLSAPQGMEGHAESARSAVDALLEALGKTRGGETPWEELAALVPQDVIRPAAATEVTREGIAVFREDEEPWRAVRILFVLGFKEGRYPAAPGRSPVFDAADVSVLKNDLGFALESAGETMALRRDLLLRQLRVVRDRALFFVPMRDPRGEELAPSGTTAFMARLFDGVGAPEGLLLTLEKESDREKVAGLALAPPGVGVAPMPSDPPDPELSADLLTDDGGKVRPVSPSALEKLMVSPLAWFLDRVKAEPLSWAPETLDPALKGTLAHYVFEKLFAAGAPPPTAAKIRSSAERLLNEAIREEAPFLTGTEWYVERRNLLKDIGTAALRWREILERSGAKILLVETGLKGEFEGVPIRGRTDLVLSLPSGRLFVVDYKKAGSATRRKAMEEGYDLQASLYRAMLRDGQVADDAGAALADAIKAGARIGVLYYMMDDQKALCDTSEALPRTVTGIYEMGDGISVNAEALVRERLRELRAGRIALNNEDDGERFGKLGVKTYALENNALVAKFLHPAREEEEAEE